MAPFIEISLVIGITALLAILVRLLRQPLIIGYIITGILVGPHALNLLHATDHVELFSKIGITVLLFVVGLGLNPTVIREVGKVSLVTGVGQVVFTSVIGFIIALILGIDRIAAIYVAIALTFSSTIIILKLLSDRGDVQKLYGKIAIGFLLVQDVIATIILLVIATLQTNGDTGLIASIAMLLIKGMWLFTMVYAISTFILPAISSFLARSQELLFLFSLAWGLGLASAFYTLGFSVEIGALVAGVALSVTPFALEVGARLRPLRDFFIVLFFVLLGAQMNIDSITSLLLPAMVLSLFVLIGNPIIVIVLMNVLGYKRRTAFFAGLTVAQISEFSLILATLGFNLGHLSQETLSLITMVGLVTIAGSTYLILYSDTLYRRLEKYLKFLELRTNNHESGGARKRYDVMLFGYDRVGEDFVSAFEKLEKPFVVVDFNPESIKRLQESELPCLYGDAEDTEFLNELDFESVKLVVATIPDVKTSLLLTRHIRKENEKAIIIVLSHRIPEAQELYHAGASYVMMPHYLGAQYATRMIARLGTDPKAFEEEKEKHLGYLSRRSKQ
ncbi:cation:proton antiporter [Candidatus Roizmanbacteria bacterium]|nr:cation:proton antiporter [Candidatus Roizmanbacteria bacterium]